MGRMPLDKKAESFVPPYKTLLGQPVDHSHCGAVIDCKPDAILGCHGELERGPVAKCGPHLKSFCLGVLHRLWIGIPDTPLEQWQKLFVAQFADSDTHR